MKVHDQKCFWVLQIFNDIQFESQKVLMIMIMIFGDCLEDIFLMFFFFRFEGLTQRGKQLISSWIMGEKRFLKLHFFNFHKWTPQNLTTPLFSGQKFISWHGCDDWMVKCHINARNNRTWRGIWTLKEELALCLKV